ncbi:restriction endonuclease subunit S [Vibrio splendidus]|uniref:restriction endonuclease subunit S n=1 Tax=Vibrio splendidus TaxID=29497 RepID=UPI0024688E56|nr:restriction endonuclease subunit S [Vibrio splendidus]MDH5913640.1 restriction endonuclease subunit S [Vibrio splendidus]MDH5941692.1 restriction endonuclease subunit S [Vibrio splendidus]MDH5987266.1 restriction endonuclease subunit S [Vibrio splendidus]MDH5993656.1 restriction endonuclease subunit S [Vibrio splendidus]MDH6007054.1 restriction endonuclease subunit S [Vibrio splendidus]
MIKLGCNTSLPAGWQWAEAGKVIDIRDGTHDSPKPVEVGIPLVTSKNLKNGKIDFSTCTNISAEDHEQISKRSAVDDGDILYAMIGTIGNPVIVQGDKDFSIKNVALFKFSKSQVFNRFFYHLLGSSLITQQFKKNARGGTQKFVSLGNIRALQIPLPPLDEQKRIAAILDKADTIRQKRKQAIDLADEFLRSVFLDMFGDPVTNPKRWQEYVLKDITNIRSGVAKGKKVSLDDSVTLPYMRVANVQDGYLDLSEIKQIVVSEKDANKCKLEKGDVLLTEGGDPDKLGRGYVWNNEIESCIHQNHIFSVRIDNHNFVHPHFLSAQISSQRGKLYFLKVGKQTTGIATINKTVLSDFVVFIPPLELQKKYVAIKNKLDDFKRKCEFDDLTLFRSISHKTFSGGV